MIKLRTVIVSLVLLLTVGTLAWRQIAKPVDAGMANAQLQKERPQAGGKVGVSPQVVSGLRTTLQAASSSLAKLHLLEQMPELMPLTENDRFKYLRERQRQLLEKWLKPMENRTQKPAELLAAHLVAARSGNTEAVTAANALLDRCGSLMRSAPSNVLGLADRALAADCVLIGSENWVEASKLLAERARTGDVLANLSLFERAMSEGYEPLLRAFVHDPVLLATQQQATRDAIDFLAESGSRAVLFRAASIYSQGGVLAPDRVLYSAYYNAGLSVSVTSPESKAGMDSLRDMAWNSYTQLSALEREQADQAARQILARCCPGIVAVPVVPRK